MPSNAISIKRGCRLSHAACKGGKYLSASVSRNELLLAATLAVSAAGVRRVQSGSHVKVTQSPITFGEQYHRTNDLVARIPQLSEAPGRLLPDALQSLLHRLLHLENTPCRESRVARVVRGGVPSFVVPSPSPVAPVAPVARRSSLSSLVGYR